MDPGLVVLVAEDHEPVRRAEAEALTSLGYVVLTAADAEEALQVFSQSRIDLLLTDIRMPGRLNGIALARVVRQSWPTTRIVIVSFDVDQFDPEDFRAFADGVLKKPFKLRELEEQVARLIGMQNGSRQVPK